MPSPLVVGTIVLVSREDYLFNGKEGQVVGFDTQDKKEPIRVWFGRECDYKLHYTDAEKARRDRQYATEPPPESEQSRNPRTWSFSRSALTIKNDWSIETLAERIYGRNMFHHYVPFSEPFTPGEKVCEFQKCTNKTTQRVIFNFWGTVIHAEGCAKCAKMYHGKMGEYFPLKADKAKTA